MVIMKINYLDDEEIIAGAIELLKAINADYEGIELLRKKCDYLKTMGVNSEIHIHDDLSAEIVVIPEVKKPN